MKKKLILTISFILIISLFVGCSGEVDNNEKENVLESGIASSDEVTNDNSEVIEEDSDATSDVSQDSEDVIVEEEQDSESNNDQNKEDSIEDNKEDDKEEIIDIRKAQRNYWKVEEIAYVLVTKENIDSNDNLQAMVSIRKDFGIKLEGSVIPIGHYDNEEIKGSIQTFTKSGGQNGIFSYDTFMTNNEYLKAEPIKIAGASKENESIPFSALVLYPYYPEAKALEPSEDYILPEKQDINDLVALISINGNETPDIAVYQKFDETAIVQIFYSRDNDTGEWSYFKAQNL